MMSAFWRDRKNEREREKETVSYRNLYVETRVQLPPIFKARVSQAKNKGCDHLMAK